MRHFWRASPRPRGEGARFRGGDELPAALAGKDIAKAYFGIVRDRISSVGNPDAQAALAVRIDDVIKALRIVKWTQSPDRQNQMRTAIEDEVVAWASAIGERIDFSVLHQIIERCLDVARVRLP